MKTIIFYISFFQVAILFSQPPEENKVINSSFNSNTANPIIVMDSIQIENLNEVEIISTKKSSKNKEDISNSKQEFKSISTTSDKFIQKKKVASNQSRSRSADAPLQEKMDEDVYESPSFLASNVRKWYADHDILAHVNLIYLPIIRHCARNHFRY